MKGERSFLNRKVDLTTLEDKVQESKSVTEKKQSQLNKEMNGKYR